MCVAVVMSTLDTIDAFSINIATSHPTRQAMHSVVHQPSQLYSLPGNSLADGSTDEVVDDYDVTCYIVNEEEIITDHEKPHVVCTSEPEEYAWFNGIDPKMMVETDDAMEGAVECKEGESYKGKPEWECE